MQVLKTQRKKDQDGPASGELREERQPHKRALGRKGHVGLPRVEAERLQGFVPEVLFGLGFGCTPSFIGTMAMT